MIKNFWNGFLTPLSGVRYLKSHPKLLALAIIPFLINIFAVLLAFGVIINNGHWVDAVVTHVFVTMAVSWYLWLAQMAFKVLVWITFLIFAIAASYLVTQLLASPFSSLLAERTLVTAGGMEDRPFAFKSWASLSVRMFKVSLIKTIIFLVVGGVLLLISLFPIASFFAHFGLLLMLAFDSADYSFENLGFSLRQRIAFFFGNLSRFIGFAFALGIVLLIPGLNFFLFPASIVGASLLVSSVKQERNHGN